ncbi:MAG TPA: hypothetical protein VIA45_04895 [Thermoanaerobaculia bacterium]
MASPGIYGIVPRVIPGARDGDPEPAPHVPTATAAPEEILACAEALGIPWRRILLGEIEAEQRLRRYVGGDGGAGLLPEASTVLSFSVLRSWRVRDEIETLACQARSAVRGAERRLRLVVRHLIGKEKRDPVALGQHFWFAYQRVLLLQRVRRAAARSRGSTSRSMAERLAEVCARARCSYDDAAWAICQEDSPRRGERLEAAVRKVREEGFLVPRASTEARSLAELRRIALTSPHVRRHRPSRVWPQDPVGKPRRVALPVLG